MSVTFVPHKQPNREYPPYSRQTEHMDSMYGGHLGGPYLVARQCNSAESVYFLRFLIGLAAPMFYPGMQ